MVSQTESKHFSAPHSHISRYWCCTMSPWLGILFFFILRAIDRDAEKKEQENAGNIPAINQDTGAAFSVTRDTEPVYGHDVPTAEQQNAKSGTRPLYRLPARCSAASFWWWPCKALPISLTWGYWFDWASFDRAGPDHYGGMHALCTGHGLRIEAGP